MSTVMPVVLGALFSLLVVYVLLFSAAGASSPAVFFFGVCSLLKYLIEMAALRGRN